MRRTSIAGLEAGADDYLTKPVDHAALLARVRAMLRIKGLHDTVQEQATPPRSASRPSWPPGTASWKPGCRRSSREIERMRSLKRFLRAAARRTDRGARRRPHSRNAIAATSSSCSAICAGLPPSPRPPSPRKCVELLREYHGALGPLVTRSEGTLDHFSGDGIMVFFNDPLPCPDPAERAAAMAVAMREAVAGLQTGMAAARARDRLRDRHRAGLRDAGTDRVRRAGRLHRDRDGLQSRGTALRRRRRRPDSRQPPHRDRDRSDNAPRTYRRHRPQGPEPSRRGVQHRRGAGIAAPPARA